MWARARAILVGVARAVRSLASREVTERLSALVWLSVRMIEPQRLSFVATGQPVDGRHELRGVKEHVGEGRSILVWEHVQSVMIVLAAEVAPRDVEACRVCLLYTSPSPRDRQKSRMPSSA